MTKYREKATVEAWQVPIEKDRRKTLPEWVADWHPGRVPEEKAIVFLSSGLISPVLAMAGDYLVRALSNDIISVQPASYFTDHYEPAGD